MCWPPGGPWLLAGTLAAPCTLAGPLTPGGPWWPLVGSWLAGKAAGKLWPLVGGPLGKVWPGGGSGLGWPEVDPAPPFCGAGASPGLK